MQSWYVLTDKWILAQKLRIPKIQFSDHMKLKKDDPYKGEQNTHGSKYGGKLWSKD